MKFAFFCRALSLLGILFLSSCRYAKWAKQQLPQVIFRDAEVNQAARFIRSRHLYNQFETVAHIDALWLCDEVRSLYAFLHARKNGLCQELYTEFERRQLEENHYFISFYILISSANECSLNFAELSSDWSIYMKVHNIIFEPVLIKQLEELPAEYKAIFGIRYNKFKRVYLAKFDAADCSGNQIITPCAQSVELWFSKPTIVTAMRWYMNEHGNILNDARDECNILAYDLKS